MRKTLLRTLVVLLAIGLVGAGSATAIRLRIGNIIIVGDGGFSPTKLPKHKNAPIKLFGHATFKTVDGTRPSPLRTLTLEFDKHGAVETRGLPKCSKGRLVATTTPQARKLCPGAIVGTGFGTGVVELPEQRPIEVSSPLTLFNGPVKHGNPTVIGHAHIDYPGPTTYLVEVEIQKVHHGRYGFKTVANFPKIVNGYGSPTSGHLTIGREWNYHGKKLSYANAHCADGRLQAKAQFTFEDGSFVEGTIFKPCTVRE
ncbi:MAG TPA: hypothetical protein VFI09_09065 [Solirubrobacterales bacterium]|nr:hypothetical protein [Solirubrobacterales bacterium]